MIVLLLLAMVAYFCWLWFGRHDIRNGGSLYLRRFFLLMVPNWMPWPFWWRKVFVHYIRRADADRHLHNHPWPRACAYILRGGYDETIRLDKTITMNCRYRRGDKSFMAFYPGSYHRITSVLPGTLTLFLAGRREREWSFLVDGRAIDWREYLGLPYETKLRD